MFDLLGKLHGQRFRQRLGLGLVLGLRLSGLYLGLGLLLDLGFSLGTGLLVCSLEVRHLRLGLRQRGDHRSFDGLLQFLLSWRCLSGLRERLLLPLRYLPGLLGSLLHLGRCLLGLDLGSLLKLSDLLSLRNLHHRLCLGRLLGLGPCISLLLGVRFGRILRLLLGKWLASLVILHLLRSIGLLLSWIRRLRL